jgi:uracil DNA glycosylase
VGYYGRVTQKNFDVKLRVETQHLQNMLLWLKKDVVEIQDDKVLKKWAKQQLSMIDSADGY